MPTAARPRWEAAIALVLVTQLVVAGVYLGQHHAHLAAVAGGPCLVRGDDPVLDDDLLHLCLVAVPAVTAVWGQDWPQHAVLVVDEGDSDVAALVEHGEVHVHRSAFERLSPQGRQVVVTHEVTHLATKAVRGEGVPTWLIEGFADYVGYLRARIPVARAAQELAVEVRAGRVPRALPSEAAFDGGGLPSLYAQAWLAVALLVRTYGQGEVVRLYRAVAAGTPVDRALPFLLHLTVPELTAAWRADLQRELR